MRRFLAVGSVLLLCGCNSAELAKLRAENELLRQSVSKVESQLAATETKREAAQAELIETRLRLEDCNNSLASLRDQVAEYKIATKRTELAGERLAAEANRMYRRLVNVLNMTPTETLKLRRIMRTAGEKIPLPKDDIEFLERFDLLTDEVKKLFTSDE